MLPENQKEVENDEDQDQRQKLDERVLIEYACSLGISRGNPHWEGASKSRAASVGGQLRRHCHMVLSCGRPIGTRCPVIGQCQGGFRGSQPLWERRAALLPPDGDVL